MTIIRFTFDSTQDITNDPVIVAARRKWSVYQAKIDEAKRLGDQAIEQCLAMGDYSTPGVIISTTAMIIGNLEMSRRHLFPEDLQ